MKCGHQLTTSVSVIEINNTRRGCTDRKEFGQRLNSGEQQHLKNRSEEDQKDRKELVIKEEKERNQERRVYQHSDIQIKSIIRQVLKVPIGVFNNEDW